ncbi:MAG TPA: flavin reductase, partial [Devosia sp.]
NGSPRVLEDLAGFHGGTIAREDVAAFVVDQVKANNWLGRSPLVTW